MQIYGKKTIKILHTHFKRWLLVLKPKMKTSLMLIFTALIFAFLAKIPIFAFASVMTSVVLILFLSQSFSLPEEVSFRIVIHQNSSSLTPYIVTFCFACLLLLSLNLLFLLFLNPKFGIIQFLVIFVLPLFVKISQVKS